MERRYLSSVSRRMRPPRLDGAGRVTVGASRLGGGGSEKEVSRRGPSSRSSDRMFYTHPRLLLGYSDCIGPFWEQKRSDTYTAPWRSRMRSVVLVCCIVGPTTIEAPGLLIVFVREMCLFLCFFSSETIQCGRRDQWM